MDIETDVCVVGSGAGGSVLAKRLAEGGRRVVMLEKGRRFSRNDFNQREERMFPQLFEDAAVRATVDQSIVILHAKGVGGTTLVNHNICFRAPEFVLKEWSRLGVERISPEAMNPYYEAVEREISVTRIRDEEVNRNDQIFHRAAERLGLNPQRFLHNRTSCIGCGFCSCGCAYDRQQNMALTYIPKAEAAGAVVMANTEACKIERTGCIVTAITAIQRDPHDASMQKQVRIRARMFVIAGGGISTPALLLRSGFGRLNPNIGRHLTLHPILPNIGLMTEPVFFYEGIPQCEYVDKLRPSDGGGFLLEGIGANPVLTSLTIPSFGADHQAVMDRLNYFNIHYVMVKDRPQGRVSVSGDGALSIAYTLDTLTCQSLREGMKLSARIYFTAGAERVSLNHVDLPLLHREEDIDLIDRLRFEPNRMALFSPHQMSSCRMGRDPKTSVTDAYGKVHEMDNLYISDASLFPTSLGYNPQLTIMALALRNAERLLDTTT